MIYPLDYGYLAGTNRATGRDRCLARRRSQPCRYGIACTADATKRDAEIKLLLGCTEEEMETVQRFSTSDGLGCIVLRREYDKENNP